MKLNGLNNLHFVLAGAIAAVIALFVYMCLDMRNLERSLLPEVKPTPQTSASEGNSMAAAQMETGNVSVTTYHEPVKKESLPQQRMGHAELGEASAKFFREQTETPTPDFSDDWMFERGEDMETKPTNSRDTSRPEESIEILSKQE